jgi:hypothetical protein
MSGNATYQASDFNPPQNPSLAVRPAFTSRPEGFVTVHVARRSAVARGFNMRASLVCDGQWSLATWARLSLNRALLSQFGCCGFSPSDIFA